MGNGGWLDRVCGGGDARRRIEPRCPAGAPDARSRACGVVSIIFFHAVHQLYRTQITVTDTQIYRRDTSVTIHDPVTLGFYSARCAGATRRPGRHHEPVARSPGLALLFADCFCSHALASTSFHTPGMLGETYVYLVVAKSAAAAKINVTN